MWPGVSDLVSERSHMSVASKWKPRTEAINEECGGDSKYKWNLYGRTSHTKATRTRRDDSNRLALPSSSPHSWHKTANQIFNGRFLCEDSLSSLALPQPRYLVCLDCVSLFPVTNPLQPMASGQMTNYMTTIGPARVDSGTLPHANTGFPTSR
ncbi:hypothetical protein LZ30DRAFT_735187 [Colletotrichum cereale]|nr:hypothetical protein LZ30DRAFT_735187 [Colletotrichum cereale]